MEIQKKYDILTNYLRGSGKALGAGAFITSLIALVVFVLGSYYGFFRYYETIVGGYYDAILQGVASYQSSLVRKDTYKIDLKKVAFSVKERRGVLAAWCTDRYGRLIFHTDEGIMRDYESKRLPSGYYESVTHRWTFENGLPVVFTVELPDRLHRRLSIPLYAFGTDDYDFVLGVDVKRFVFLPSSPKRLVLYTAGSLLIAFLLLFFPLLLFIRGRFAGILSQTRYMLGTIQLDVDKEAGAQKTMNDQVPADKGVGAGAVAVEEAPEEAPGEEEVEEKELPEIKTAPAREKRERKKTKQEASKEEPGTVVPSEREIEEKMKMIPLLMLMETKQMVFKKQDVTLPFLEAANAVFHSRGTSGSYLHFCGGKGRQCYTLFSYPDTSPEEAASHLSGIGKMLEGEISGAGTSGDIMKSFNAYCLQNKIKLDASILLIAEGDRRVEYCSAGAGQALYLKHGESEIKSLRLDVPGLGSLSKNEFNQKTSYAEITFVAEDIFLLMPYNGASVFLGDESFEDLIKRVTLTRRKASAGEIVKEVHSAFDSFRRKEKGLPESGFAVVKFL